MEIIRKFTGAVPSFIDQMTRAPALAVQTQKKVAAKAAPPRLEVVSVDTDYPSEGALEIMRGLQVPKLKKLTTSLF